MDKKSEKHTFVVCAYKESPYLKECIKSLLVQTIESKIIMVSSTKNDYIANIGKKYNIPVFYHEDGGIARDWNFGLSLVKTDYATLIHQDDLYLKKYLEKSLEVLEKNKDSIIAFTNYKEYRSGRVCKKNINLRIKDILLSFFKVFPKSNLIRNRVLSFGSPICCPAVTYNLKNISQFTFSEYMTVSLDWEAWYRLGKMKGSFCYIPEVLVLHRIHSESETTNAITNSRRSKEDLEMFRCFWPEIVARTIARIYSKSEKMN